MSERSSRTVLVVDDDHGIRMAMSDILQDEGYRVVLAENGVEALEKLRAEASRPIVILLDLMMPKMDGPSFRGVQSNDPALSDIPVVIVSANLRSEQTALQLGAAGVLAKPFKAVELLDMIERFC